MTHMLQAPNYPDAGRCWDIVDKYKISIFYTAPTLVRSLMREGDEVSLNLIFNSLSQLISSNVPSIGGQPNKISIICKAKY